VGTAGESSVVDDVDGDARAIDMVEARTDRDSAPRDIGSVDSEREVHGKVSGPIGNV
jgi:hypothetical protein